MASDEYLMNTRAVSNMAEIFRSKAAEYLRIINESTAIVNELSSHWEGNTYETFKEGYFAHLESLEDLNRALESFSRELDDRVNSAQKAVQEIKSILGK